MYQCIDKNRALVTHLIILYIIVLGVVWTQLPFFFARNFIVHSQRKLLLKLHYPQHFKIKFVNLHHSNYFIGVIWLQQIARELIKLMCKNGHPLESHCMAYGVSTPPTLKKTTSRIQCQKRRGAFTTFSRFWLEEKHPVPLKQRASK